MFDVNSKQLMQKKPDLILFDWDDTLVQYKDTGLYVGNIDKPFAFTVDFIEYVKSLGVSVAVVSNTRGPYVRERAGNQNVDSLQSFCSLFDLIIGARDVVITFDNNSNIIEKPKLDWYSEKKNNNRSENRDYAFFIKPSKCMGDLTVKAVSEKVGKDVSGNVWMVGDAPSDIQFARNCGFLPIGFRNQYAMTAKDALNFNDYYDFLQWFIDNVNTKDKC